MTKSKSKSNTSAKKASPAAEKLVDELVKKEVDALRVRSKLNAGHPHPCCI